MINYKTKHLILTVIFFAGLVFFCSALSPGPFILPIWAIIIIGGPLLLWGVYIITQHPFDGPDILTAAKRNDKKYMRWLLDQGVGGEKLLAEALLIACQSQAKDCVVLLLDHGADPNWEGYSEAAYALISELQDHASCGNNPEEEASNTLGILHVLLKSGADLSLPINKNNLDTTSLDLVKEYDLSNLIPAGYLSIEED